MRGTSKSDWVSPVSTATTFFKIDSPSLKRTNTSTPSSSSGRTFATIEGDPIPPYRISGRFSTLVRRVGLAPLRFHDLRHTAATLMLRAGVHPKIVSERLGHATVAITLDTYSHVLPDMQRDAAAVVDVLLARQ